MTRDKLVERIARAMWEATYCDGWSWPELITFAATEGHVREAWAIGNLESFREKAAASLAAIEAAGLCIVPREPTEGMIQAVLAGLDDRGGRRYHNLGVFKEAWSYAIAAAGEG